MVKQGWTGHRVILANTRWAGPSLAQWAYLKCDSFSVRKDHYLANNGVFVLKQKARLGFAQLYATLLSLSSLAKKHPLLRKQLLCVSVRMRAHIKQPQLTGMKIKTEKINEKKNQNQL